MAKSSSTDASASQNGEESLKAVCELVPVGSSGVTGTIQFSSSGNMVQVRGDVAVLKPGKHGFHVHEQGGLSDKVTGKSTGGHFNPTDQPHGRPSDTERHVGDIGNIEADKNGKATVKIDDAVIKLSGDDSIVGRGLVIHAEPDQFTQPTGDACNRVTFGVIEKTYRLSLPKECSRNMLIHFYTWSLRG
ncbi:superoxide dismutase family protein [Novipirellula rosea]|uniref:Superoxide dismutase family protein n=1 Tax=Novipirellula rosea TaxID=1031540 RepID=A0ABP8MQJ6_9BACT